MKPAFAGEDSDTSAAPRVFDLAPAMPQGSAPEWPDARWVGDIRLDLLGDHDRIRLQDAVGYDRARLLVRDGASVLGFVDVPSPGGLVSRAALDAAVLQLAPLPRRIEPVPSALGTPSITVIVCTRDRASQLRLALSAILALEYPNFTVVIVDNASKTTDTADLVRREFADPRVSLVTEPIAGLSRARNTGLAAATGEIVAFTDDDVVVDASWLTELAAAFGREPEAGCVTGLVPSGELRSRAQQYFDERVSWSRNLAPMSYSLARPPADSPMFPFSVGDFGTGANFALRRDLLLSLGGFDQALGVGTRTGGGEDIDMFTRVLLAGRALVVQPSAIVWHRHRADLSALRVQAIGYGTGLGAWLTKILLNRRTASMAMRRGPVALARLISIAFHPRASSTVDRATVSSSGDELHREIRRVGMLELISVLRGPANYLMQRRADRGAER